MLKSGNNKGCKTSCIEFVKYCWLYRSLRWWSRQRRSMGWRHPEWKLVHVPFDFQKNSDEPKRSSAVSRHYFICIIFNSNLNKFCLFPVNYLLFCAPKNRVSGRPTLCPPSNAMLLDVGTWWGEYMEQLAYLFCNKQLCFGIVGYSSCTCSGDCCRCTKSCQQTEGWCYKLFSCIWLWSNFCDVFSRCCRFSGWILFGKSIIN